MMSIKRQSPTIILADWITDCDQALADAEYLVGRLGKYGGGRNGDLTALSVRIAALRAQLDLLSEAKDVRLA